MDYGATRSPRRKELFVVRPNVRSRIRRESASLSRSRLPVNDNLIERLISAGWSRASVEQTSRMHLVLCYVTVKLDKESRRNRLFTQIANVFLQ